jgi:predicted RNA binding protein YcfA (HicA-like mRNA interferase family)
MPKLPLLSGREVVKIFERLGWEVARQKGSHIILIKKGHIASLSVPDHRELPEGHCAP